MGSHIRGLPVTRHETGFLNRTDSVLSFVTRTFTIASSDSLFNYYIAGITYTVTASDSITIADTSGLHVIYYDGETLTDSVNPTTSALLTLFLEKAVVVLIYWNATDGVAYLLADERHGSIMATKTHIWIHEAIGAVHDAGLTLSGYVEDTESDAALTFKLTDGQYSDEDIAHDIIDGDPAIQYSQQLNTYGSGDASIPIVYRDASGVWKEDAASTLPYKTGGTGRLAYNRDDGGGSWSQVEVPDGKWVSMTLIATNDWQYPIKAIQGQNAYTDKKTAVEQATAEIIAFGGGTLSPEVLTLYRFVMRTKDTFGGTKKALIEVDGVTDFRTSGLLGGSAVAVSHASLEGLDKDDHAQYLLADGTRVLSGAWDMGSQNLTNVNIDSGTIDGATITAPVLDGIVTNTGATLVMPAFTLSGTLDMGNQALNKVAYVELDEAAFTPSPLANYGKLYTMADNKFYFQDGAGNSHELVTLIAGGDLLGQATYDLGSAASPFAEAYIGNTNDYLKVAIVGNIPTLYGMGAYLRVGDATTAGHVSGEDDLLITGGLEADGSSWFDGSLSVAGALALSSTLALGGDITGNIHNVQGFGRVGLAGSNAHARHILSFIKAWTIADDSVYTGISFGVKGAKTSAVYAGIVTGITARADLDAANTQNWTLTGFGGGLRGANIDIRTAAGSSGILSLATGVSVVSNFANAATVTDFNAIRILTPIVAGGKLINLTGLYMENMNTGATLNYAIKLNGGAVDLALPGADPTVAGQLWSDGGVVTVSAG